MISSAMSHWAHYIIESHHPGQLLTDSRPCVQAYTKLVRGEFSCSARVSTFLSTLSRYNVTLQYIPGLKTSLWTIKVETQLNALIDQSRYANL